ncbi:ATP-grasp domain-containing protein [Legionella israelensis]|uniref:ATP-grasp domain-containing protein n=2 Tax=Legionella israelensis TaxID=454 RepID=A0AAX1EJF4_9GAMM|nr:ATP-grasp domain-containing protein [Legionella israelensis]
MIGMKRKKNIFVMGLDDFNLKLMKDVSREEKYEFHGLLDIKEILDGPYFDVPALLHKAKAQLQHFSGSIDAIVGYWDFPAILLMPILRREFALKGPTLESVLKCEHKYWSRLEQQKVVPQCIPQFILADPNDENAMSRFDFPLPFWIKPVKAHSSMFGFRVNSEDEFYYSRKQICAGIGQFSDPLNAIMNYACLPEYIKGVHGRHCLVEEIISAKHQCTLEGYVFDRQVEIYGVVDSIRGENQSSFERYEYPSRLPKTIQERMKRIARLAIIQTGLQYSPFNIEFFYDPDSGRISLLEINARISKSHSPLFQKVDGVAHNEIMIDVALGKRPSFPFRQGRFKFAAKFMPRLYGNVGDTNIVKVPDAQKIREIERHYPGTEIHVHVKEGMRLSELYQQDSYSYQLATIFMGADDHNTLLQQYLECLQALDIQWRSPYETSS